MTFILRRWKGR